jgi:pimeloyl-ACP methyl ester carboxylesterase
MQAAVLQTDSKGQGEPVVLVPGALTGWLSWIPHQEELSSAYRVVRVQPLHNERGSAGEPGHPDYTADIERESLRLTLDSLGLERVHFGGWSGGGRALIEFALAYPDRVRSLTLVEPAAYWILEQLGEFDAEVRAEDSFLQGLVGRQVTEDDLAFFLRVAGFVREGEDPRRLSSWQRWLPHRTALSWQTPALAHPDRTVAELERIAVPTLLVRGTLSTQVDRRIVEVLAQRLPDASMLELEGDHACHIEQIEGFLDAFRRHLTAAS